MSSLDVEECSHKLMKLQIRPGQEVELCTMLIECCSQERAYLKFYGLIAQRFCNINPAYVKEFDDTFAKYYSTIHRLETNKLRNIAKLFAHLLHTDALPWGVLEYIHLNETETTSSSRIFIKILFQEMAEHLGTLKLKKRLEDRHLQLHFEGILPRSNPRDTRCVSVCVFELVCLCMCLCFHASTSSRASSAGLPSTSSLLSAWVPSRRSSASSSKTRQNPPPCAAPPRRRLRRHHTPPTPPTPPTLPPAVQGLPLPLAPAPPPANRQPKHRPPANRPPKGTRPTVPKGQGGELQQHKSRRTRKRLLLCTLTAWRAWPPPPRPVKSPASLHPQLRAPASTTIALQLQLQVQEQREVQEQVQRQQRQAGRLKATAAAVTAPLQGAAAAVAAAAAMQRCAGRRPRGAGAIRP